MDAKSVAAMTRSLVRRGGAATFGVVGAALVGAGLFEYDVLTADRVGEWFGRVRWLPTGLVVAGVGVAATPLIARWRGPRATGAQPSMRPLRWWVIVAAATVVGIATWAGISWLLAEANHAVAAERPKARIDAIRAGLSVGAGAAGAVALLLAARRQWLGELGHAHQEKVSTAVEHDAGERRITELFAKAVEQLGHEKPAVRLGGLYALERLAQNNPAHRQTVINVLCAYLRMSVDSSSHGDGSSADGNVGRADQRRGTRIDRSRRVLSQRTSVPVEKPVLSPSDPGESEVRRQP